MTDKTVSITITLPLDQAIELNSAINAGAVGLLDIRDRALAENPESAAFLKEYYSNLQSHLGRIWCDLYHATEEVRGNG